jgi:tRNA (adenine57-N1/adenine58-N1)-methyltransferase
LELIREGDTVLVYIDEKRKFPIVVRRGSILGTDKGFIRHDEIIGKPYGSTLTTSMGVKALLFKPLRQDYIPALKRITQIIHPKDAALMIYLSGVGPGSRVGEAGVGSGALTIAIASIIGDNGVLYGYDISEQAIETTMQNLEKAGLKHRVVLALRDVREGVDVDNLDAFFLDIPDPWNALPSVSKSLKNSGVLLAYVPTINQVEKTVVAMRQSGVFGDIHVYELLLREMSVEPGAVRPRSKMIGHTGYVIFARKLASSDSP